MAAHVTEPTNTIAATRISHVVERECDMAPTIPAATANGITMMIAHAPITSEQIALMQGQRWLTPRPRVPHRTPGPNGVTCPSKQPMSIGSTQDSSTC